MAAATGFEDYAPGKYTGVGEGSRYTGDVYEGQGRTGEFVPGVGIMDDILNRLYPGGDDVGSDRQPGIGVANRRRALGSDRQPGLFEGITEDITADIGGGDYTPYPDEKWGAPLDHPYADIYDFERQRQKATFTPKLYDEDRTHPTLPLGPRRITSEPGQVTYPFGPDLLNEYYGSPLASDVALGKRGYGAGPNEIFEEEDELYPTNPRSRILAGG